MQSKTKSLLEVCTNVSLGFVINWCAAFVIFPAFGYEIPPMQVTGITVCYTVLAIVRGFCVRRFFNA